MQTGSGSGANTLLWVGRVMSALPVLMMVGFGTMGLIKPEMAAQGFAKYGYPAGALTPILITEIAVAILYAIPQTAMLGAILMTGYLGGAVATHVHAGEPFYLPIIVGMVVWGGLYFRDARVRRLIPLRDSE